jgi:glycosyltransferase involved in cell wall biosynthesis
MLVRDEADIIEATIRHLFWHVDEVIVADNRSVDGTREILEGLPVDLRDDPEVGFWQPRKTTAMAMEALERGHEWVLPCDTDEIWHCRDPNQRIADYLASVPPDVIIVKGNLFIHIPSAEDDPSEDNPVRRIGYRQIHRDKTKPVCRLTSDLQFTRGNHSPRYLACAGKPTTIKGKKQLVIRHFPHRSEEQTVGKYRNKLQAYAAQGIATPWHANTNLVSDANRTRNHFRRLFSERPTEDDELTYDPAPARCVTSPVVPASRPSHQDVRRS